MTDTWSWILTVAVLVGLIAIIWSKIMEQSVLDTVKEWKDIVKELFIPK